MAKNPFSDPAYGAEGAASTATSNPFSNPDYGKEPSRGFKGWAGDALGVVARGAISLPEAAVGLLDIPTGGAVGKALENEGGSVGLRFKQAKEAASDLFDSDATKQQNQQFQQADGIVEKAKVALSSPAVALQLCRDRAATLGVLYGEADSQAEAFAGAAEQHADEVRTLMRVIQNDRTLLPPPGGLGLKAPPRPDAGPTP